MNYTTTKQWPTLNLALSPEVFSLLDELIKVSGHKTAEFIQTSLAVYQIKVDAIQEVQQRTGDRNDQDQQTNQRPDQDRSTNRRKRPTNEARNAILL